MNRLTKTQRKLARTDKLRALHTWLLTIPVDQLPQPDYRAHICVNPHKVQHGREKSTGKLVRFVGPLSRKLDAGTQHKLSQKWLRENPERTVEA